MIIVFCVDSCSIEKSKIHEMYLNLSTWIRIVTVLRKYDPQVTEDTVQVFYGHCLRTSECTR
jgi:hypothetical protein